MPSYLRPSVRSYRRRDQRGHRFFSQPRTLLLVFLSLVTTVVLSSVLADARIERAAHAGSGNYPSTSGKPFLNQPAPFLGRPQNSSYLFSSQTLNRENRQVDSELIQDKASGNDRLSRKPREERLVKADSFNGDLRDLPYRRPVKRERPEREGPEPNPIFYPGTSGSSVTTGSRTPAIPAITAPAPAPSASFEGLDFANWGAGHPPDTNGDVGPTYYIQTVNTSIGIYRKSDGVRVAAFTFDTFMSQGNFGNVCDTDNFGDPVVLYDSFEDRWIISDFAFILDGNNVVNPPGSFQCIAASKTGDPVLGGWNFYSINTTGGLGDYPKFGIWPDGLYMSVNMFDYAATGSYQNPRVYAFNKAQMYAGAPTVQSVSFNAPTSDFTLLPSNARLQTGTPPLGSPNYFVSTWQFLNALSVYKFHVDWGRISLSTFTGPDVPLAASSWPGEDPPNAPSQGGNNLDVLGIRAMMQNQYSNIGGTESLWTTHTVRREATTGFAAPRWYQVGVTGGTVAANIPQAATWDPDGANVIYRFMPSLAVDRMGDMAIGYSTSSSTTKPAIKYAGRLATDPINTLGQTEQVLIQGTGTQTGNCGPSPCSRWGDYSAMSLDPNGCTFWYTNEYYAVDGLNDLTRIGSFAFPQCIPVGSGGTVSGTVTDSVTTSPISGAKVELGSRSTTTNGSGFYTFTSLPAGTYPAITASFNGYGPNTATSIIVTSGATTTQNFALSPAPLSACLVDTSQADFQTGVPTNVDLTTSPGDVVLLAPANVDQQNLTVTNSGFGFNSTNWVGQTFTPAVTGSLARVDLDLFCSGCTGTTPDLIVSIRATSGNQGEPSGADLAVATIPGFSSGSGGFFSANFSAPATLTAGTKYAVIIRATANPSAGSYAYVCSCASPNSNPYASGERVTSNNSGATWSTDNTAGGRDLGFIAYMKTGFSPSGNLVSGAHDANPPAGLVPHWTTLSWNAITPANTAIKFQGAASNSIDGPFNFVGPDGTAATFFTTSGASLAQFNGLRFFKYKALLSTTDSTTTPTLNDVTSCFSNGTPMITAAAPLVRQRGANANGQIATVSDPFQAANTLNVTATPLTGTGVTITNISIDVAGNVTANVAANCVATNSTFTLTVTNNSSATATATLSVNVTATATPTITPGGPINFCTGGSVTLTSSSAIGNQWFLNGNPIGGATNQQYVATVSGNYVVVVTELGCATTSAATSVTVNSIPATPTITPSGATTFCDGGSVTLTSSSASGNQWYRNGSPIVGASNQQYVATLSGNYTTIVTTGGCSSSPSAGTTVTVNPTPPTPTITPGGATTFCDGGSVTLTSSSASGNQWYRNGSPIVGAINQQYVAAVSGNYTTIVTTGGCSSSPSTATTVTVNSIPATPTITPSGATTFCDGGSVTLTSSSASGNQWYRNGSPIVGASNQQYVATLSGNYTTIVTTGGCSSSPSAGTTVTVNPTPPTPTITPGGATTFCDGGSVALTSSSASGNQWYRNGSPIVGASNQQYVATVSGNYTTIVTTGGCSSSPSTATTVTVNSTPPTPTITPSGATTFCDGGSVTLTSSGVSGNQWYRNGNVIAGATGQQYLATVSGNYTTIITIGGCSSSPSAATTVTVNPTPPTPTITPNGPTTFFEGESVTLTSNSATGNQWYLNGNPISGATNQQYIANASGNYTVKATANGCTSAASAATTVTVNPVPVSPTFTKSFNPTIISLNSNSALSFTISNPNTTSGLSGVGFTDNLPAGLVVAATPNVTGSCGNGTIIAAAGSSSVSLSGGTLTALPAVGSACTFTVAVTGTSVGTKNNVTGNVSATYSAGLGNPVPITGGTAAAAINVLKGDQTISLDALPNKVFGDVDFMVSANASSGLPVSLTAGGNCTVTSPSPGAVHITGAGSCTITASQVGDGNYNAATNVSQSFDISQAPTTTDILASINPSDIGQNVVFTATVTAAANTNPPNGTVQFKDGAINLGAALNCVAGIGNTCKAEFSISTLTTGTHAISAVYSGETNFTGSVGLLSGGQVVTNLPTLQLLLEEFSSHPNLAASLDSLLLLRDPFPIKSLGTWFNYGPDRNTRVIVFVASLQLNPGESSSAVVVHLIDSNNQSFDVPAEDVRAEPVTGFAQVTFRLPDTLSPGDCTVQVKAHGQVSNSAIIRIGP